MKITALNLKDTFKVWKIGLIVSMLAFSVVDIAYLIIEIPHLIQSGYHPIFGFGYYNTIEMDKLLSSIITMGSLLPVVDVSLFVFIRFLSKWEKDASQYGLSIDNLTVDIVSEGKTYSYKISDICKFEVLPKNCEPTVFKSKWAGVIYIVSENKEFKLYYLKNGDQAKKWYESNKIHQST